MASNKRMANTPLQTRRSSASPEETTGTPRLQSHERRHQRDPHLTTSLSTRPDWLTSSATRSERLYKTSLRPSNYSRKKCESPKRWPTWKTRPENLFEACTSDNRDQQRTTAVESNQTNSYFTIDRVGQRYEEQTSESIPKTTTRTQHPQSLKRSPKHHDTNPRPKKPKNGARAIASRSRVRTR